MDQNGQNAANRVDHAGFDTRHVKVKARLWLLLQLQVVLPEAKMGVFQNPERRWELYRYDQVSSIVAGIGPWAKFWLTCFKTELSFPWLILVGFV